jgi:hypothetical protein
MCSWYVPLFKSICACVFCILLPCKLDNFLDHSWFVACLPLYAFALVELLELVSYQSIFANLKIFQREDAYRRTLKNLKYSSTPGEYTILLWDIYDKMGEVNDRFSPVTFSLHFNLRSQFERRILPEFLFNQLTLQVKISQVVAGILFKIILPFYLELPHMFSSLGEAVLIVLLIWNGLFLCWVSSQNFIRHFNEGSGPLDICLMALLAMFMLSVFVLLVFWFLKMMWFHLLSSAPYWIASVPAFVLALMLLPFPCWLTSGRRYQRIPTSDRYFHPDPMDDPGTLNYLCASTAMCYPFAFGILWSLITLGLKMGGNSSRTWCFCFVGIWLVVFYFTFLLRMLVKSFEYPLKQSAFHLLSPHLNDIWQKEVLLGYIRRLKLQNIDVQVITLIFEYVGLMKGMRRHRVSPYLLQQETMEDESNSSKLKSR